ncbi:MAG: hypothetical protein K0Q52_1905 [Microbacterium sp.]|nr:hypothetical protein [Microbacterium sp.]
MLESKRTPEDFSARPLTRRDLRAVNREPFTDTRLGSFVVALLVTPGVLGVAFLFGTVLR